MPKNQVTTLEDDIKQLGHLMIALLNIEEKEFIHHSANQGDVLK